ncbi:phage tail protein [Pseudomonas sp. 5P_3.1_Bac2]|uniref:gp53-like domain-containing protein n=1 Tax=Pseudomonas sp. 5P_3.1_Bac2 TaxID=2971617 RepID=UPI0021CA368F|nr:phage tail protein [Pseudomonas sp. 5P_3.1_Bac2]MCU1717430.1 phage tail protein [Pseudomonas sp. 5P_3.1_Bac2]
MPLNITITDAGRAEIINAQNTGTNSVVISQIGFGTGQYQPSKQQTALKTPGKRLSTIAGQAVAADTIHVMVKDESNDAYNVGEFGLFSASGTLIAVYSQVASADWIMQKSAASTLLLATDIILESLNATSIKFGDVIFVNPPASTTVQGVVELATAAETQAGTDSTRVVTPAGLTSLTASTSRAGLVQLDNSLSSTSDSKALTAAQGRALNELKQDAHVNLQALSKLAGAADRLPYFTGAGALSLNALTPYARSLLDDGDAAAARSTLGAAPLATPAFSGTPTAPTAAPSSNSTQLATTAFVQTAANTRQPLDGTLTALAGVNTSANQLIYSTGADQFAVSALTPYARTLLDDGDAATALNTLGAAPIDSPLFVGFARTTGTMHVAAAGGGLEVGRADGTSQATYIDLHSGATAVDYDVRLMATGGNGSAGGGDLTITAATVGFTATPYAPTVPPGTNSTRLATTAFVQTAVNARQPLDNTLSALAGLNTGANQLIYSTAPDQFAVSALTPFARTLLDDGDAATARNTLGAAPVVSAYLTGLPATSGTLHVATQGGGIEIGRLDGVEQVSYIDFHSGAIATDYDVRLLASSGNGSSGEGHLAILAAYVAFSTIPVAPTAAPSANNTQLANTAFVKTAIANLGLRALGSMATNGWHKCQDTGLIRQWGITAPLPLDTAATITFPLTFPNRVLGGNFCQQAPGFYTSAGNQVITAIRNAGMDIFQGDDTTGPVFWEAWGY